MPDKMTILEYADTYLPEPIRKRYIFNCTKHLRSDLELDKPYLVYGEVSRFATDAFHTFETAENHGYWSDIGSHFSTPLPQERRGKYSENYKIDKSLIKEDMLIGEYVQD